MVKEAYIREMCMNMGCTRAELFKMFAEYQINLTTTYAVIFGIAFVLGLIMVGIGFLPDIKENHKYDNIGFVLLLFGIFTIILSLVGCLIEIPQAVAFHDNPMAAVEHYLDAHVHIVEN